MTTNRKGRIQKLVQICKQKAMSISHKICEYSLIVLRIVVVCVAVLGELLFAVSKFLFSRFMELPVRIRAISAGVAVVVVVVFLLWPKGHAVNDNPDRRRTSQNAIASFNGVAKNMNYGVLAHDTSQINHSESTTSSSQYSKNSLAQFNGVAKSMNSSRMLQENHGVRGVVNGASGSNYNKNDIATEHRCSGIPGTRYYNPYYEAYRPTGSCFGGCGNPYGAGMNFSARIYDMGNEPYRPPGYYALCQALKDPSVARAAEIAHNFERDCIQRRLRDSEGRLAELRLEDKMRKTQKELNDIDRESFLRVFRDRSKEQQSVMDKYDLEQLHPGGWQPLYGANPGDPNHFKDKEGKLHKVEKNGTHYEYDARAAKWYKMD